MLRSTRDVSSSFNTKKCFYTCKKYKNALLRKIKWHKRCHSELGVISYEQYVHPEEVTESTSILKEITVLSFSGVLHLPTLHKGV